MTFHHTCSLDLYMVMCGFLHYALFFDEMVIAARWRPFMIYFQKTNKNKKTMVLLRGCCVQTQYLWIYTCKSYDIWSAFIANKSFVYAVNAGSYGLQW